MANIPIDDKSKWEILFDFTTLDEYNYLKITLLFLCNCFKLWDSFPESLFNVYFHFKM